MYIENSWIFDEYKKVFPHFTPCIFAQEQMLDRVKDKGAWQRSVSQWAMNHYKPQSVGKLLDYYDQQVQTKVTQYVGKSDESTTYPPLAPCQWCGDPYCLKTHDAERQADVNPEIEALMKQWQETVQ